MSRTGPAMCKLYFRRSLVYLKAQVPPFILHNYWRALIRSRAQPFLEGRKTNSSLNDERGSTLAKLIPNRIETPSLVPLRLYLC